MMTVTTDITLSQLAVLDSTMAYREAGDPRAPAVLFLHGNPTSSYIWRNVIPFHLAARKPEFVRGLAFMEFIRPIATWDDFHPEGRETFQKFRTPGLGEKLILEGNAFVEQVLPSVTIRKLTDEEMAAYRAPFPTPESRRPTWRFPNDLPIAGEPADVYSSMLEAHAALSRSSYHGLEVGPAFR
jgi:haloalkane dehalogenase